MSKALRLLVVTLLMLYAVSPSAAQSITINLLNTPSMDFAAFAFENNLKNQPRIIEFNIIPENVNVKVRIIVDWKKNDNNNFVNIGTFTTNDFLSRRFNNSDIGNSEITIPSGSSDYNQDLLDENIKIGKPSGIYKVTAQLLNVVDERVLSEATDFLYYLNPTEPTILSPTEGNSYDLGSILVSWTPSMGASGYRIIANEKSDNQSKEEALSSSAPLINNVDVGNVVSVNFREILSRELLADTNIVISVKAVIQATGGEQLLSSPIVMFRTNSTTTSGTGQNLTGFQIQSDPNIVQLADFLQGKVDQRFIDDLKNGIISADTVQLFDEFNNPVQFSFLLELLSQFQSRPETLISIQYTAQ